MLVRFWLLFGNIKLQFLGKRNWLWNIKLQFLRECWSIHRKEWWCTIANRGILFKFKSKTFLNQFFGLICHFVELINFWKEIVRDQAHLIGKSSRFYYLFFILRWCFKLLKRIFWFSWFLWFHNFLGKIMSFDVFLILLILFSKVLEYFIKIETAHLTWFL